MKKALQAIFCKITYSNPVEDVKTHQKQTATCYQIFGITYKTTYKPFLG
jgi:hypothetical protein